MPSKKKKYNARFPPARIKKIMQTDEEIGKVAAAVPVIIYISESPGAFLGIITYKGLSSHPVEECKDYDNITLIRVLISLLHYVMYLGNACAAFVSFSNVADWIYNTIAKSLVFESISGHEKQCIELEQQFDFLKDLVAAVPDMQGEGEENHTEGGGEKVPRRGRKPGSAHKNGGAGSKGKDKKLSGTESEQEEDSEESETDGDEEDGSQSSTNQQAASRFHSPNAPPQYMHMDNMVSVGGMAPAQPRGSMTFAPHPSMMSAAQPPTAPALHKTEDYDDEDYDS